MDYIVRKARESDKLDIAKTIADSFEKSFRIVARDTDRVAGILENGIAADRFYVAERDGKIIGIAAYADCTGRAMNPTKDDCQKHFGRARGLIIFKLFCFNLLRPLTYPATTGYIDIVGVVKEARGKGVAKELLREIIRNNSQYNEFVLDTDSINASAIKSYTDFGFVEIERVPIVKFVKRSKVVMKYIVQA